MKPEKRFLNNRIVLSVLILAVIVVLSFMFGGRSGFFEKRQTVSFPKISQSMLSTPDFPKEFVGAITASASVYSVTSSNNPGFVMVVIDPLDVHPGDIQKMFVEVKDETGVSSVLAEIEQDHGTTTVPLKLVSGDAKDGFWYGEWKVEDTHAKMYHTIFTAFNEKGEKNYMTMAWSDPCSGVPNGGSGTLTASCTVSGVEGVDGGTLNLNGFTLTINSGGTFAFNSGQSVTINGTIAIGSGGQLRQTNLWYLDSDLDQYVSSLKVAQDTQPAGGSIRVDGGTITVTGVSYYGRDATTCPQFTACNGQRSCSFVFSYACPGDPAVGTPKWLSYNWTCSNWPGKTASGFNPAEASGSTVSMTCYNPPNSDCYDSSSTVNPVQTAYFTVHRGDGSFDYNCSGSADQQYPNYFWCDVDIGSYAGYWDTTVPACGAQGNLFTDSICTTSLTTQACR